MQRMSTESVSSDVLFSAATWQHFGHAAHLCVGRWCRFHLATAVGPWLVSTVGEYVHPRNSGGSETAEGRWLAENHPGEEVGLGRKYETMVFRQTGVCECGCGMPIHDGREIETAGTNTAVEARAHHLRLCDEFSRRP